MRDYEVVYIFKSVLGTEEIEARVQTYHEKILVGPGAAITAIEHWGKRELAYPIDKDKSGYYVVAQFTAPPDVLTGFERTLKLDDDLIRHLVVISEGELPTPPSDIGGGPGRDRRDSDDDDDDFPRSRSRAEPTDDDDDLPRSRSSADSDDDDEEEEA